MPNCIETTSLTKRFGSTVAVDGLSIEVQSGEIFGLLGPNGAGKSTTLYMLSGLMRPSAGSLTVLGKDIRKDFLDIAARIGVVPERPVFYDYLSARQNLMVSAQLAGRSLTLDRALDRAGLLHAASKKVRTFSSGMRQRLALAQALLLEPELLILDEPANGLDPEGSRWMLQLLRQLADEANVTIVFSSHMLHEVEALCDRVAIISQGRLMACERTDALLSYDQTRVEVLLDAPEAASRKLDDQPWTVSVSVRPGRMEVVLREPNTHQLIAFLVNAGYRVSGVIPQRRTLQDYFLKVLNS
ncbi:MAG: ATP-binding cassette domain-containing protein [Nitrospiraceae bacterium]|nr:ATP-binding cassette domain-containing protein [Nitrospiraceae bacterium]